MISPGPLKFFDDAAVAGVLSYAELIPAMRQALIAYSRGDVEQPARRFVEVPGHGGYFASMTAAGRTSVGAKLVSVYPGNAVRGLHTHMALIALFDPETGTPLAVLDARRVTEMRTAAVTATFVDAVAPRGAKTLAMLGAGVQGRAHLEALPFVRRFANVVVWNRGPERAEGLATAFGGLAVSDVQTAVRDADVVVVATASPEPILDGAWLRPGAVVASVGWAGRDGAELDASTMSNIVIVDSREGAAAESGNVRRHKAEVTAELGELLDGRYKPPTGETIVLDSIGMACQDVAAARLVYDNLRDQA